MACTVAQLLVYNEKNKNMLLIDRQLSDRKAILFEFSDLMLEWRESSWSSKRQSKPCYTIVKWRVHEVLRIWKFWWWDARIWRSARKSLKWKARVEPRWLLSGNCQLSCLICECWCRWHALKIHWRWQEERWNRTWLWEIAVGQLVWQHTYNGASLFQIMDTSFHWTFCSGTQWHRKIV